MGHNVKFDLLWVWSDPEWKAFLQKGGRIWDTLYGEYLLSGQRVRVGSNLAGLDQVAQRYGGSAKIDEIKKMWQKGVDTSDIHYELLSKYLVGDLKNTEKVFKRQIEKAAQCSQLVVMHARMEGVLATAEMEYNGLFVDLHEGWVQFENLRKEIMKLRSSLEAHIPKQVPAVLRQHFNWLSVRVVSALFFGGVVRIASSQQQLRTSRDVRAAVELAVFSKFLWPSGFRRAYAEPYLKAQGYSTKGTFEEIHEKVCQFVQRNGKFDFGLVLADEDGFFNPVLRVYMRYSAFSNVAHCQSFLRSGYDAQSVRRLVILSATYLEPHIRNALEMLQLSAVWDTPKGDGTPSTENRKQNARTPLRNQNRSTNMQDDLSDTTLDDDALFEPQEKEDLDETNEDTATYDPVVQQRPPILAFLFAHAESLLREIRWLRRSSVRDAPRLWAVLSHLCGNRNEEEKAAGSSLSTNKPEEREPEKGSHEGGENPVHLPDNPIVRSFFPPSTEEVVYVSVLKALGRTIGSTRDAFAVPLIASVKTKTKRKQNEEEINHVAFQATDPNPPDETLLQHDDEPNMEDSMESACQNVSSLTEIKKPVSTETSVLLHEANTDDFSLQNSTVESHKRASENQESCPKDGFSEVSTNEICSSENQKSLPFSNKKKISQSKQQQQRISRNQSSPS